MNFNFDPVLLTVMYSFTHPGLNTVTMEQLINFDHRLAQDVEPQLTDVTQRREVPQDKLSRSRVLTYKFNMPGNTLELQLENACIFYKSVEAAMRA